MKRIVMAEQIVSNLSFTKSCLGQKSFEKGGWVRTLNPKNGDEFQNIREVFDAVSCFEVRAELVKNIAAMVRTREMPVDHPRYYAWLQNWVVDLWGDPGSIKMSLTLLEGYLSVGLPTSNENDDVFRPLVFAFLLAAVVPSGEYDGELSRLIFKRLDEVITHHHDDREQFLKEFFPVIADSFLKFALRLLEGISKPDYEEKEWSAARRMLKFFYLVFGIVPCESDDFDKFITPLFAQVVRVYGYHVQGRAWPKENSPTKFELEGIKGQLYLVAQLRVTR